jgi:hypothetical protein
VLSVVCLQKVQPETKLPLDKPQNKKLPHKPRQHPHRKLHRQPHRKKKNPQCWRYLRQHHPLPPHQL